MLENCLVELLEGEKADAPVFMNSFEGKLEIELFNCEF
jgi:hypothetical protein